MDDDHASRFPRTVHNRSQAWLIEETNRVAQYLCALRTQLNTYAPISRLPEEILQEIFLVLVASSEQAEDLKWTRVTHVCRHWRQVALKYGVLWTYVCTRWPSYVAACIERSADAPLRLQCSCDGAWEFKTHFKSMELFQEQTHRFVSLDTTLRGVANRHIYDCIPFAKHWPALKFVSLKTSRGLQSSTPVDLVTMVGDDGSKLRYLQLHNMSPTSWSFGSTGFNNLRTLLLSLRTLTPAARELPEVGELLDFLERCPMLEELELVRFLRGGATRNYPAPRRTIHLNNLISLFLEDANLPYDAASFLSHLSLPRSAHLYITSKYIPSNVLTPLTDCLPRDLGSTLRALDSVTAVEVSLTKDNPGRLRLRCSLTTIAAAREDPYLEITAGCPDSWPTGTGTSIFPQLRHIFHQSPVHTISLNIPVREKADGWRSLLAFFPFLTTLIVHRLPRSNFEQDFPELLDALTVPPSLPVRVVPRLAALHLVQFNRLLLAIVHEALVRCVRCV